jgi:hypothetical protein
MQLPHRKITSTVFDTVFGSQSILSDEPRIALSEYLHFIRRPSLQRPSLLSSAVRLAPPPELIYQFAGIMNILAHEGGCHAINQREDLRRHFCAHFSNPTSLAHDLLFSIFSCPWRETHMNVATLR